MMQIWFDSNWFRLILIVVGVVGVREVVVLLSMSMVLSLTVLFCGCWCCVGVDGGGDGVSAAAAVGAMMMQICCDCRWWCWCWGDVAVNGVLLGDVLLLMLLFSVLWLLMMGWWCYCCCCWGDDDDDFDEVLMKWLLLMWLWCVFWMDVVVVVACGAVLNDVWGSWLVGWIPWQVPTVNPRQFFACMHPVKIYVELFSSQSAFYLK